MFGLSFQHKNPFCEVYWRNCFGPFLEDKGLLKFLCNYHFSAPMISYTHRWPPSYFPLGEHFFFTHLWCLKVGDQVLHPLCIWIFHNKIVWYTDGTGKNCRLNSWWHLAIAYSPGLQNSIKTPWLFCCLLYILTLRYRKLWYFICP